MNFLSRPHSQKKKELEDKAQGEWPAVSVGHPNRIQQQDICAYEHANR
jgi:hypothetical protein